MSYFNKFLLLEFQMVSSFIWQYTIKTFKYLRYLCLSLVLLSVLVYLEIFPKNEVVKLVFIVFFLGFNAFFLIRGTRDIRNNYPIKMSLIRKLFQCELGLKNHELFSINDTLNNIEVKNSKQQEYWNKFISSIKSTVDKKYSFKLKYFFLNDKILDNYTKISLIGWIFFSYFMLDQNFYKNFETSISFEKQQQILTIDYSMNVLIYAPDESKNPIVYLDNKYNESAKDPEIFLIKKNSKILMNFYNLRRKDIKIKIKNNDKIKLLENIKIIDSTTFQLEDLVENGEYTIYLKNKIFQKFTLEIDKKPTINFISEPKLTDDFRLSFNYELIDENNLLTLIELSKSLEDLVREKGLNQDLYNKTNTNPINYIILSNSIREKKANTYSFKEDIRHLPISGGNIYLKLTSFDKNEQPGTSKVKKIYLPKKIFQDDIAKEIIRIRESVFNRTKIKKIIMQLERENILNHSLEINQIIENLIYYTNRQEIDYEEKQEALVNGLWRAANIIEINSIDKLVQNIEKLKLEIESLLDQNIEGDELLEKMNQLENLINKYMSLKKEKTKLIDGHLDENHIEEDDKLKRKSANLNDRAKSLLEKAENLFNKKNSKVNNNILKEIQKLYLKQKKLIDDTYSEKNLSKEQRKNLSLKQKQVFDLFSTLREDLLKIISSDGIFVKKIEERFIQIIESFDKDNHENLVKKEIDILNNLKELYNKIKKKSDSNKIKKESKNNKSNPKNYNDENNFDTPIIFESNSFKKIIETIRKMTNDENRHDKEKEYLKRLLPNF